MSKETNSLRNASLPSVTEATPQLATLAHNQIVRSKTNPRTHFDADYIKELTASIVEHGLLQPILVRPLPASRLQDTFEDRAPGEKLPTHELVCGECRWRAAGVAGTQYMPVLIRDLTDLQVLQVQLVENLKRRDLHPLEEAEGFDRLIKDHGLTVEDIAARVDKSASQIYVTLKLLELTPECREELYAGKLTRSTALLVARQPAYQQKDIAHDIMNDGFDDEPMTYRQAQRHIQQHYMLKLANAVFDIKDASLVAKAGACGTCAKNTGANSDLFGDVAGGAACTDSKCFDAKKVAHFAAVTKAAAAKGQVVIQGKEAKELISYEGATPSGYQLLDKQTYINGKSTTLRKLAGKDAPVSVLIVDPFTKQAVEALPVDVANKLIKKADSQKKGKKELSPQELKDEYERAWKVSAVKRIFGEIMAGKMPAISVDLAREIALDASDNIYGEDEELVSELLGVGKVAKGAGIEDFVKDCSAEMVAPALLLILMVRDIDTYTGEMPFLDILARDTSVELADVQDQVKAEIREAAAAKSEAATPKAGRAKGGAKAKKTSAADAKAGIAKALEAAPPAGDNLPAEIGHRVRIKEGVKRVAKYSGREGVLGPYMGDTWKVNFEGKESCRAKRDEFVVLEDGEEYEMTAAWPFPTKKVAAAPAQP